MNIDAALTLSTSFENNNGDQAQLFISHLDAARFNAAHTVLGKAYTMLKSGKVHPDVFCVDYKEMFQDDMDILNPFLEYHFTNALIVSNGVLIDFKESPDTIKANLEKAAIDSECLNNVRGLFFFIAAVLRYSNKAAIVTFGELFTISQTLQAWRDSHKLSLNTSQADSVSDKGAEKIVNI